MTDDSRAEDEPSQGPDDSRLLSTLFASSGVHSALQHDSIMEASRPEVMLVEREATRVAKEAAHALRESRRELRRNEIGTPTWTGRSGGTARFGSPNRTNGSSVMSSEYLLARMRGRQALEGSSTSQTSIAPINFGQDSPQSHVLIGQIQEFLSMAGGSASSKELVARFPDVKGVDEIAEFRKMVKQIAVFKDSVWRLKDEYI